MPKWPKISKANSIESCIYKLQLGLFVWNSMKVLHACKKEIYHGKFRSSVSSIVSARNTLPRGQVKNAPILIFFSVSSPWLHIWPRQIDVIISWTISFPISFPCCFDNPFRLRISALHGSERFPQADQPDQTTLFLFYKSAANFLSTSWTINIQDTIVSFWSSRSGSFIMGWVKGG